MSRPWMLRRVSPLLVSRSRPSSRIWPSTRDRPFSKSPMIDSEVTDLPDPLSPTTATVSPAFTSKDTSWTTVFHP